MKSLRHIAFGEHADFLAFEVGVIFNARIGACNTLNAACMDVVDQLNLETRINRGQKVRGRFKEIKVIVGNKALQYRK